MAGEIAAALQQAFEPMGALAARLQSQFNTVGGTIITLAHRIDDHMKFQVFEKTIQDTRKQLQDWGTTGVNAMDRVRRAADVTLKNWVSFASLKGWWSSRGSVVRPMQELQSITLTRPIQSIKVATSAMRSFGTEVAVALGAFGLAYKVVGFFTDGISGAIHLNEVLSKTNYIFGDSAAGVERLADQYAKSYGFIKSETLDVVANLGILAKANGLAEGSASELSSKLLKLAADENSFNDVPFAESAAAFTSALRGQSEPASKFGILLNENRVKAEAFRLGLGGATQELSEHAKFAARASLIMKNVGDAEGDLARTANSAANQFRRAGGGVQNFAVSIGQVLLPAVTVGINAFNELLATVLEVFEQNKPMIESWGGALTGVMERVGYAIRNMGAFWRVAQLSATQMVANVLITIDTLPENFSRITAWLGRNWLNLLVDFTQMAAATFTNLLTNATDFGKALWDAIQGKGFSFTFTPLLKGFEAATEKFPELVKPALISLHDEMDAEFRKVETREQKLADDLAARAKNVGPKASKAEEGPVGGEIKSASAAERGSSEAVSAIARFSNQTGEKPLKSLDKTAKASLDEHKKQTQSLAKIAAANGGLAKFTF